MMSKSLSGKRIIVLRDAAKAKSLLQKIRALDGEAIHCPMLETRPTLALSMITLDWLKPFTMVIFASQQAVEYFAKQLDMQKSLNGKKIIPVGAKTAKILEHFKIPVSAIPQKFSQEGILEMLDPDLSHENILLPNALDSRPLLENQLKARHAKVTSLAIYESVCPKIKPVEIRDEDFVIFTSSMMARFFFASGLLQNQKIIAVCIGEITQGTVLEYFQGEVLVADEASEDGILKVILSKNH
jgi:uroporphyrinogen-III synthase